jgi:Raf kinase inhibitor-like YbhB/YbcL family protein
MPLQLTVDGFPNGGTIPVPFTCEGENSPPVLSWSGAPPNTKSFALILDDPDAPGGTWNHWLLWDIPARIHSLQPGSHPAKTGKNDFGQTQYGGPCPPKGHGVHRYYFRLYALDCETIHLAAGAKRPKLDAALDGHVLAEAEYMGHFRR